MQSILVACPAPGAIREAMDRDSSRKRDRGAASAEMSKKKRKNSKKKGKGVEAAPVADLGGCFGPRGDSSVCRVDIVDVTDAFRPPGLFEFPWQKEGRLLVAREDDQGWEWDDLRDVFFSSLVDGCTAAIGVPGDRLSPCTPARGSFCCLPQDPTDGDTDGDTDGSSDCVWSTVLRQPFSTLYTNSNMYTNSNNCNA